MKQLVGKRVLKPDFLGRFGLSSWLGLDSGPRLLGWVAARQIQLCVSKEKNSIYLFPSVTHKSERDIGNGRVQLALKLCPEF